MKSSVCSDFPLNSFAISFDFMNVAFRCGLLSRYQPITSHRFPSLPKLSISRLIQIRIWNTESESKSNNSDLTNQSGPSNVVPSRLAIFALCYCNYYCGMFIV